MQMSCLFAAVLALATPGAAVAQTRPPVASAVNEQVGIAARAKAFAVESLVLMAGELQAAIEANDDDLARASPYLDLIYLRYSARGDAIADQLQRASLAAAGAAPELTPADSEAIDRFRLLPDQTLARVASRQFGSESGDSEALSIARRLGWTLHRYTRALIDGQDGAAAASGRVTAETQALAEELAAVLESVVVENDPDERASITLVKGAILMSPDLIRAQTTAQEPDAGVALTVAYTVALRLLAEDIAASERMLRLSAPGPDRALAVTQHQPHLEGLSERAHIIGLALSTVSPATLPPATLVEQRQEIRRLIDLTAMRARIDQDPN